MRKEKKNRKGLKISILLWSLVILSGVYVGMSFFPQTIAAEAPDDSMTEIDAEIEINEDEEPYEEDEDEIEEVNIPTEPIALINYALDIYNNGKGSQSTVAYSISNKGVFSGISVSLNQYGTCNVLRCGNQSLEESYFYYNENEVPSVLKGLNDQYKLVSNYYRAINVDHDAGKVYYVQTSSYNRANQTYDLTQGDRKMETHTIESAKKRFVTIYSEEFPLEINSDTATVTSYNTKKSKIYSYVSISYKVGMLPEEFKFYYNRNSMLSSVTYQQYDYTFVINKKTGKLRRMIREEEFISPGLGGAITITSKVHFQQDFKKMDTKIDVRKPYLEYVAPPKDGK